LENGKGKEASNRLKNLEKERRQLPTRGMTPRASKKYTERSEGIIAKKNERERQGS